MCHITFTLHVYKLTFTSGFSGDGGGVSSFVSEQPLRAFKETLEQLPVVFMETKLGVITGESSAHLQPCCRRISVIQVMVILVVPTIQRLESPATLVTTKKQVF